jgi:RNA polymerase sporulation-specific sigma factor
MHFRAQRKVQGEVSLSETLEAAGEEGSLSLMDILAVDDDMQEELDTRDACQQVRRCVNTCLTPRERMIITMRYGLDDQAPRTQREIAAHCGISRSYVSRIEKKALEKLQKGMEGWTL